MEAIEIKHKIKEAEAKYPEGIYFDMPEDDYHALPFFSRSLGEHVVFDLEEAAYKLVTPTESTPAMQLGTAIHLMLLEPDIYKKTYVVTPNPEDYEQIILDGCNDLKKFLESVGEKKTGNKEDLIARTEPFIDSKKHVIWDKELESFNKNVAENKLEVLTKDDFELLSGIQESFNKPFRDEIRDVLSKGYPEVTIVSKDEETGLMCKCRLDYVRISAIGELKSFSVKNTKGTLDQCIDDEIRYRNYNLQAGIYQSALTLVIDKINNGKAKVFGNVDKVWIDKFLAKPTKKFYMVFARTQAPYQMRVRPLSGYEEEGASPHEYLISANNIWRLALSKFAHALQKDIWYEQQVIEDRDIRNVVYQMPIY